MPTKTAKITEAGRSRDAAAKRWRQMPRVGQHQVNGLFNGKPYRFILTRGKGYAYVERARQVWYIDTEDGFLSEGAAIDFAP